MILLRKLPLFIAFWFFSISALFGQESHANPVLIPKKDKTGEEHLEEQIAPPPPPALIDLQDHDKKKEKTFKDRYASLGLFLFNSLMFVGGMIVVKTTTGKKVEES